MWLFKKKKARPVEGTKHQAVEVKQEPEKKLVVAPESVVEPVETPIVEVPKPVTSKPKPTPKAEEPVKKQTKPTQKAVKPVEQAPVDTPEDVSKESKTSNKYHVSQNKDPKSDNHRDWRVRKEGSNKTIKFFETQKEAIEYAESLAEKVDGSVVIHKMDGKIRQQSYKKKA